ncbi:MAG: LPS-assembly protein LptD [Alphaproteobacteria bacterium]
MKLARLSGIRVSLSALLWLVLAHPAWAQVLQMGSQSSNQPIAVTADKLSSGDGGTKIEASGNVEVKRELTTLKAQDVTVNRETQDVEAKGNVSLDDPEYKIKSADSLQMNLQKEIGEIQNGNLFIEQGHLTLSGARLQKSVGQTYHVDEGFFTTCLCDSGPSPWRISGDVLDLAPNGVGTIRGGYFYVLDVPVFYLPYGFFPVKTDRQSGFLIPKIGSSTKDGFRYQQPFFWAISKSTDATAAVDFESRSRWGFLGELRTIFNRDADLRLDASYFNESLRTDRSVVDGAIADKNIPIDRFSVIGTNRYLTTANWLIYSDIAAYSDDLFARELIDRFDLPGSSGNDTRRSRYGESAFGLFKSWGDTFVKGEWNFFQDFIQRDQTTYRRTPQLLFWGRRLLEDFPLEFRWRVEGVNYLRKDSGDGLRLDLRPEAVLPFNLASYLFGSLSVAPRETAYHLYSPVNSARNISRELVEIRGNVATSVSRVFAFDGPNLKGIKHVIEPELSYLFVPGTNQRDIPIMDYVDRVNRRNIMTFAIANRFLGKFASPLVAAAGGQAAEAEVLNPIYTGDVRELASLRLALSYDIDQARKGGDSLSDLDISLRLTPLGYLAIGFDGGLNPGRWQATQARATFAITDPRPLRRTLDPDFNRPNSISLSYQYLRKSPNGLLAENANFDLNADPTPAYCASDPNNPNVFPNHTNQNTPYWDPRCTGFNKDVVGQVSGSVIYHLHDQVMALVAATYDIRDNRFPGYHTAVKFLSGCECWSATLSWKHDINPAKNSFNFDFNLLGLGAPQSTVK